MSVTISGDTGVSLAANVSGTVAVANGGTGATSLTANNVILGNGTSAVQAVAPGTSGNVLTSNGTSWVSQALPAGGVTSLNGQTGAITNTSLYAIGSYVVGRPQNNNTDYQVDTTIAGSSLYTTPTASVRVTSVWASASGGALAAGVALVNTGTWRCVSPALRDISNSWGLPGLWVRIS